MLDRPPRVKRPRLDPDPEDPSTSNDDEASTPNADEPSTPNADEPSTPNVDEPSTPTDDMDIAEDTDEELDVEGTWSIEHHPDGETTSLRMTRLRCTVQFEEGRAPIEFERATQDGINQMIRRGKQRKLFEDNDHPKYGLYLSSTSLSRTAKEKIYLPHRLKQQNTGRALVGEIMKVMQSEKGLQFDDDVDLEMSIFGGQRGGSKRPCFLPNGITLPPDNFCFFRALALLLEVGAAVKWYDRLEHNNSRPSNDRVLIEHKKRLTTMVTSSRILQREAARLQEEWFPYYDHETRPMITVQQACDIGRKLHDGGLVRLYFFDEFGARIHGTVQRTKYTDVGLPAVRMMLANEHYTPIPDQITKCVFKTEVRRDGVVLLEDKTLSHACKYCGGVFGRSADHLLCSVKCTFCFSPEKCRPVVRKNCGVCCMDFLSDDCYANHLEDGKCYQKRWKCTKCHYIGLNRNLRREHHECGRTKFCPRCTAYQEPEHNCRYTSTTPETKERMARKSANLKMCFYDFETQTSEVSPDGEIHHLPRHVVTHVVAMVRCDKCVDSKFLCDNRRGPAHEQRVNCCEKEKIFKREDGEGEEEPLNKFCQWLFKDKSNNGVVAIAHNGGKYDTQFVLRWLLQQKEEPELVVKGNQIVLMKTKYRGESNEDGYINGVSLKDSLLFIPVSLKMFTKTFGLDTVKGHFPYDANCDFFRNRQGPDAHAWPEEKYFGVGKMKPAAREEVVKFIEEMVSSGRPFVLEDEIIKYCVADVRLLMEGVYSFRKLCMEISGIDPIAECCTIASYCMKVFNTNHMTPEIKLPIIREAGYWANERYSMLSEKMIAWLSKVEDRAYEHHGKDGEKTIRLGPKNTIKFDAYFKDTDGKEYVVEINGCFYHGHTCMDRGMNKLLKRDMDVLYEETLIRRKQIIEKGYEYREFWECEIKEMLENDPEMKEFFNSYQPVGYLVPRCAFVGGRTQSFRLWWEALGTGQQLYYLDVTSLYPYINKTTPYPLRNPERFRVDKKAPGFDMNKYYKEEEKDLVKWIDGKQVVVERFRGHKLQMKGIYFCKVLPPTDTMMPLLPVSHNQGLHFPLCFKCMDDGTRTTNRIVHRKCEHTDEERAIKGSFWSEELQLCLDNGYKLMDVYEVYKWTEFSRTGDGGLFGNYVKSLMKIKTEMSGWPRDVVTQEEKDAYIQRFFKDEGIRLDPTRLDTPSAGLRYISKLMLNSLWGKFGMRPDHTEIKICRTANDVDSVLRNPNLVVTGELLDEADMFVVSFKKVKEAMIEAPVGCLPIAIATTAHARMHLNRLLLQAEDRVIYCDTDSIIFFGGDKETDPVVKQMFSHVGEKLGDLTSEVPSGYKAVAVMTPGPKQYFLRMVPDDLTSGQEEKIMCKLRGITQDHANDSKMSYEIMKEQTLSMIAESLPMDEREDGIIVPPVVYKASNFRIPVRGVVRTVTQEKRYQARNKKGILSMTGIVRPWGYRGA